MTRISENTNLVDPPTTANSKRKKIAHIYNQYVKKYFLSSLAISALVLSVTVFVDVRNEIDDYKKFEDFEKSLENQIEEFGNTSDARILLLARELKELRSSLTKKVSDLKVSFDTSLVQLREKLNNVQTQISDARTDVTKLQTSLVDIQASMKAETSRVWAEFEKLEKEIKNLPKNSGHNCQYIAIYCPYIVTFVTITKLL